jgi:hypothetical protein
MPHTPLALLALTTTITLVTAGGAPPPADLDVPALTAKVQATLADLHSKAAFPGVSVGFVLPDGRSAGVASGRADVENQVPLRPTDRLLAGSVGKTFVAAVAFASTRTRLCLSPADKSSFVIIGDGPPSGKKVTCLLTPRRWPVGVSFFGTSPRPDSRTMVFDRVGNIPQGNDGRIYRLTNPDSRPRAPVNYGPQLAASVRPRVRAAPLALSAWR